MGEIYFIDRKVSSVSYNERFVLSGSSILMIGNYTIILCTLIYNPYLCMYT